jgi:hypothetical protein
MSTVVPSFGLGDRATASARTVQVVDQGFGSVSSSTASMRW